MSVQDRIDAIQRVRTAADVEALAVDLARLSRDDIDDVFSALTYAAPCTASTSVFDIVLANVRPREVFLACAEVLLSLDTPFDGCFFLVSQVGKTALTTQVCELVQALLERFRPQAQHARTDSETFSVTQIDPGDVPVCSVELVGACTECVCTLRPRNGVERMLLLSVALALLKEKGEKEKLVRFIVSLGYSVLTLVDLVGKHRLPYVPGKNDGLYGKMAKLNDQLDADGMGIALNYFVDAGIPSPVDMESLFRKCVALNARRTWRVWHHFGRTLKKDSIKFGAEETFMFQELVRSLLWELDTSRDKELWASRFATLESLLELVESVERFQLFCDLTPSLSDAHTVLFIRLFKGQILKHWNTSSIFCSRKIFDFLPLVLHVRNFASRLDTIMECLNFYRFLLLRDKSTNLTGVWNQSQIAEVNARFVNPLREELDGMTRQYSSFKTDEQCREKIEKLKEIGLPEMTVEQFRASNNRSLMNISAMRFVLDRVIEIITEP